MVAILIGVRWNLGVVFIALLLWLGIVGIFMCF
jgi:hypothetical protein